MHTGGSSPFHKKEWVNTGTTSPRNKAKHNRTAATHLPEVENADPVFTRLVLVHLQAQVCGKGRPLPIKKTHRFQESEQAGVMHGVEVDLRCPGTVQRSGQVTWKGQTAGSYWQGGVKGHSNGSTHKGVNWRLKDVTQTQHQRAELPMITSCEDVTLAEFMYLVFYSHAGWGLP